MVLTSRATSEATLVGMDSYYALFPPSAFLLTAKGLVSGKWEGGGGTGSEKRDVAMWRCGDQFHLIGLSLLLWGLAPRRLHSGRNIMLAGAGIP
jgi:hypothetical protein